MKLLVAEDDPVSREILARAARKAGWEAKVVADGLEAWDELQRGDYPVVLSDWTMPRLNGEELCRRVRAFGGSNYTYFIIVTATVWNHEGYMAAMDAGVDDFLNKAADPLEIIMRLKIARRISGFVRRLRRLEDIIPICSHCRRLRDETETYQLMETFFKKNSRVKFSHGICPECAERYYPGEKPAKKARK